MKFYVSIISGFYKTSNLFELFCAIIIRCVCLLVINKVIGFVHRIILGVQTKTRLKSLGL